MYSYFRCLQHLSTFHNYLGFCNNLPNLVYYSQLSLDFQWIFTFYLLSELQDYRKCF